jgi:hypothetical protein
MVAHSCELLRLRVIGGCRVQDGFGGPNSHVSIYRVLISKVFGGRRRIAHQLRNGGLHTSSGRDKTRSIGGDVAAVYFEVFQFA